MASMRLRLREEYETPSRHCLQHFGVPRRNPLPRLLRFGRSWGYAGVELRLIDGQN